jgi:hypothetical protein
VDLKAFGFLHLDDEWARAALRLALPAGAETKLTTDTLGRVRIDKVSMAYYPGSKPENSRGYLRLKGLIWDGRKRVIDCIREATAGKVQVEEVDKKWLPGGDKPVRVSGPELPFALGLLHDHTHHTAFLARSLHRNSEDPQHLMALEQLPWFDRTNGPRPSEDDLLFGSNPPWLQAALKEIPPDVCGLFIGEIPYEWRNLLTRELGLRRCPRSFVVHLRREGDGVVLSLRLNPETAGEELILQQDLEKWCRRGLDDLQYRWFPTLRQEPQALALLGQTLRIVRWEAKFLRWEGNPGSWCVQTRVPIPGPTWKALGTLLLRASQPPEPGR